MTRRFSLALIALALMSIGAAAVPSARAAFPGRNGRIAYVRAIFPPGGCITACTPDSPVSSVRPDGSGLRREWSGRGPSRHGLSDQDPQEAAYSPGGGRLLVAAHPTDLYSIEGPALSILPLGHRSRPLLTRSGRVLEGLSPSWSPGGHALLYTDFHDVVRIYRSGRTRRVASARGDDGRGHSGEAQWSRRGRIAFTRKETRSTDLTEGRFGVYTVDRSGRRPRRIAEGRDPDWSPHGLWLLYAIPDGSLMMARKRERRVIYSPGPAGVRAQEPVFSPNGRRIAFVGSTPGPAEPDLYVLRIDGSGLRRIAREAAETKPSWQPLRRRP